MTPTEHSIQISLRLPQTIYEALRKLVLRGRFRSRSAAVQQAIQELLDEYPPWDDSPKPEEGASAPPNGADQPPPPKPGP